MSADDPAVAEVVARLRSGRLSACQDCCGRGYTDAGKSVCFWCRGAGVITQPMAYAFGLADEAERGIPSPNAKAEPL